MKLFNVTYETMPLSAEDDDDGERGFILEDATLRDAINALNGASVEPSCCPFDPTYPHVWFTTEPETDFHAGECTTYSLHLPDDLTPSTRKRIARLLGVID